MVFASGYNELNKPANLLPVAIAKNQTPIINEVNLAGVNLFTIDNPIGDNQSSPIVCKKYSPVRKIMLAPRAGMLLAPIEINKNPAAKNANPIDIFLGDAGSIPFLFNHAQNIVNIGANNMINPALKLWK